MKSTEKTFTVKLHTTNTELKKEDIENFMKVAIENSKYREDFRSTVEDKEEVLYNFLNDLMAFSYFIRKSKEEFLEEYPYFAEEYDFCLSEFKKDRVNALITFLENTSTKELVEPYGFEEPEDFSFAVGLYIRDNMTLEEKADFLKLVASKGLKVPIY